MIERLRGELWDKEPRHAIIGCGGVGYGVDISVPTFEALPQLGQAVELFIHTHVREEALQLFGFAERPERELFLILQSASGVGPGLALTLLSSMPPTRLAQAIEAGDADALTRVKGVGKRTAERLALELKGKMKAFRFADGPADGESPSIPSQGPAHDAVAALVNLGMKQPQAERAIAAALEAAPDNVSAEQLVVEGLKWRKP